MFRYCFVVLALLACVEVAAQDRNRAEAPQQVKIQLKLYEGDPRSKRAGESRLLAEPVFIASYGRPASFASGGEQSLRDHPDAGVSFGVRCESKATLLAADKVLLELMLERSESLPSKSDERVLAQGDVFRMAAVVVPGRATLIEGMKRKQGKALWVEVLVETLFSDIASDARTRR